MLAELRVKNYALIKNLTFKPGNSFNVITGETGAGKSILLGAMGLVLGERADSVAVKENEEKCVIEAYFNIKGYELQNWFNLNEFDYTDELILRREILINGKSRAFINDTPAQLTQLKEIGKFLIDIHSQHDNLDLFQKSFQFSVLDSFAGTATEQKKYLQNFELFNELTKKLKDLTATEKQVADEKEFKNYMYEELLAANLAEGETLQLEEELIALSNADQNLQILASIHNQLSDSETAINDQLALIKNQLGQVAKNDKRYEEIAIRFGEIHYLLKDIASELDHLAQSTNTDPERMEIVNQRLALLHNLSKKHKGEDLILKLKLLEQELLHYTNLESEILAAKTEIERTESSCRKIAYNLSAVRKEQSSLLEKRINEKIVQLGMPGARIKIELTKKGDDDLGTYGVDDLNFLFSPADGKLFNPIQNIASGGEISRVMLVLKAILAQKNIMPTLIFDEIDTGVSGEVAFKIAEMLVDMSKHMQLIAISHLPQIAAKGTHHYYVYKNITEGKTTSDIKEITGDERINEIAEMMGGKAFSEAIVESAKQLLNK